MGVGGISAAARSSLATHCGALAQAAPLHPVLDSVIGNCRDSFLCIRGKEFNKILIYYIIIYLHQLLIGISDYNDGSRGKEWQPYASLVAAAVMKALICAMDPPPND